MPVPDVTPYVELNLVEDRDPVDLFAEWQVDAESRFPDAAFREGHTEVVIAQSYCLIAAEIIFAVKRLPGALLEALMRRIYGLERDTGGAPAATATVSKSDGLDHTLLAGTRFGYDPGDGSLVTFTVDTDLAIAAGNLTGVATITGETVGAQLNGVPAGTALQVLDAVPWIDEVVLATPLGGGRDPEDGESYLGRGTALIASQSGTVTVGRQFEAIAQSVAGVARASGIDLYDPAAPTTPPSSLGHMTLVLVDDAGAAVTAGVKTAVGTALAPLMQAGLLLHLVDPTVTAVPVTVTVHRDASLDDAGAAAAVTAALQSYLSPASWPFAGTVYVNELIALIREVPGIDRVVDLVAPAADVVLPGIGPLASAGAIGVTVQAG